MAAATANVDTLVKDGDIVSYPAKAATKLFGGTIGAVEASTGYIRPGADVAGLVQPGIVQDYCDNSAGAAGAKDCRIKRNCIGRVTYAGTAPAVGVNVYIVDDQTVNADATGLTNDIVAGKVVKVDTSTTTCWVFFAKA